MKNFAFDISLKTKTLTHFFLPCKTSIKMCSTFSAVFFKFMARKWINLQLFETTNTSLSTTPLFIYTIFRTLSKLSFFTLERQRKYHTTLQTLSWVKLNKSFKTKNGRQQAIVFIMVAVFWVQCLFVWKEYFKFIYML